eukprot:3390813-Pleurochrysis_carterae.AAC.2
MHTCRAFKRLPLARACRDEACLSPSTRQHDVNGVPDGRIEEERRAVTPETACVNVVKAHVRTRTRAYERAARGASSGALDLLEYVRLAMEPVEERSERADDEGMPRGSQQHLQGHRDGLRAGRQKA